MLVCFFLPPILSACAVCYNSRPRMAIFCAVTHSCLQTSGTVRGTPTPEGGRGERSVAVESVRMHLLCGKQNGHALPPGVHRAQCPASDANSGTERVTGGPIAPASGLKSSLFSNLSSEHGRSMNSATIVAGAEAGRSAGQRIIE